jgi:hypothetical protein
MARKYIGWTDRGPAVFRNIRRDRTGDPLIELKDGESANVTLDLTAYLNTDETISSVTSNNASVVCTPTLTSPTISLAMSAATSYVDGYAELTITLSSGEIIVQKIRARRPNVFGDEAALQDYI